MSDHSQPGSSDASYLVPIFESLRKYEGLKPTRLVGNRIQPLLRLAAVQNHVASTGEEPATAAVHVVVEQVQKLVDVSDRLVADAVLGLGIFADAYLSHQVPKRTVRILEAGGLGARRAALLANWEDLHRAFDVEAPEQPSDRNLRGPVEEQVFERLSRLLLNTGSGADPVVTADTITMLLPQGVQSEAVGKVVVVGGVAVDHIWRIETIPEVETSKMATHYARSPGGKGLNQAVAAARLGLDVSLIAAFTDDSDGLDIKAYLEAEGVDTSLMELVPGMSTPATGVFERPFGESAAAVWRNGVELDVTHLDKHGSMLTSSDVVLLTFEIPQKVLYRTLNLATGSTERRPVIIVTPGQPYTDDRLSGSALKKIDYLVAHIWELEKFAHSSQARYDPQLLSNDLFDLGLNSLCILGNRGGTIYSRHEEPISIAAPPSFLRESSITRDAFCAALAARLIEDRSLTDDAIRWAAAAMASFAEDYYLAPSPPRRERVDQKFREIF
ncbi:ribokinase [Kribbella voronezhensis]|uniref:Ribokinase n=1 Tax=Kribbella voronezhensis TaxID=2512212 RepID=A0A4R7T6D6_9ACTN|nr:PfkB family carbohydrate kinase [Kribbella voronezhensis]TDU86627.1 ribokinase [Kribbella voronezhensis]